MNLTQEEREQIARNEIDKMGFAYDEDTMQLLVTIYSMGMLQQYMLDCKEDIIELKIELDKLKEDLGV